MYMYQTCVISGRNGARAGKMHKLIGCLVKMLPTVLLLQYGAKKSGEFQTECSGPFFVKSNFGQLDSKPTKLKFGTTWNPLSDIIVKTRSDIVENKQKIEEIEAEIIGSQTVRQAM